jgi:hypothetical protein
MKNNGAGTAFGSGCGTASAAFAVFFKGRGVRGSAENELKISYIRANFSVFLAGKRSKNDRIWI